MDFDDFISSDDSPRTIDDVLSESELPPFVDDTTDNNFDDDDEIIAHDMDEYYTNVIAPYLDEWNDDNNPKNGQKKSSVSSKSQAIPDQALPYLATPSLAKPGHTTTRRTFFYAQDLHVDISRYSVKIRSYYI